ncbi:Mu transposase domain-containing protein [Nocardia sp. GAS34]|uniref:Mu transposase domain-containing protein n=1 Tax=unclassified Nocardia TaxID=2637762 RepID=UPI003D24C62E
MTTEINLREHYASFAEIEAAAMRSWPSSMPDPTWKPAVPRHVHDKDSTIRVDQVRYSVPHHHGQEVIVRWHGDDLVVTALVDGVATEIVRHRRSILGNPVVLDELYPSAPWAPQLWRDGWPTPISDRHDQIRSRHGTARSWV